MVNLLAKLGMSGGVVSGIIFLDVLPSNSVSTINGLKKNQVAISSINSLDDIELFEKISGCRFVYSKDWATRELYGAKEFLENLSKEESNMEHWTSNAISQAEEGRKWCNNETVTIFKDGGDVRLGNPPGGTW